MIDAHARYVLIAALAVACGGTADSAPTKPGPQPEAAPEPETKAAPELPTEPHVPARALPDLTITNPGHACPELPALAADASEDRRALHLHAAALRRLACEPELMSKTTAELYEELGLPPEANLDFSGMRGVSLELPGEPTVGDVAAVLGIASAQVHVTWKAYHMQARLGTNPDTGAFDHWGPGTVWMPVRKEADGFGAGPGQEKILPASPELRVSGYVMVGMPEAVVAMKPDPDAIPMVLAALGRLAAEPELLAGEPKEVAAQIGLRDERFRVAETSSHSGETVTRGVSIDPRRTTLPAAALATALGLPDAKAHNVNAEHDVWKIQAGGTTQISWHGLELGLVLSSPKGGARTQSLGELEVTFVSIMPKPS